MEIDECGFQRQHLGAWCDVIFQQTGSACCWWRGNTCEDPPSWSVRRAVRNWGRPNFKRLTEVRTTIM